LQSGISDDESATHQVHVDDLAEVRVHELHDDVEILELFQTLLTRERVQQTDDLKMEPIQ
jgi:hypothetical protein